MPTKTSHNDRASHADLDAEDTESQSEDSEREQELGVKTIRQPREVSSTGSLAKEPSKMKMSFRVNLMLQGVS